VALDSSVVAKVDLKSVSSFKSFLPEKLRELSRVRAQGGTLGALGLSERSAVREVQDIVSKGWDEIYLYRMVVSGRHLSEDSKRMKHALLAKSGTFSRFYLTKARTYMGKRSENVIVDAFDRRCVG
jgi:hypothetical protein